MTSRYYIATIDRFLNGASADESSLAQGETATLEDALAWALPILRASTTGAALDAEFIEDDESLLADAQRRLEKRRLANGLDPATGRPLQAPIADNGRTDAGTVPSATGGLLVLVEAAAAGKVRLDPGEEPKTDLDAPNAGVDDSSRGERRWRE